MQMEKTVYSGRPEDCAGRLPRELACYDFLDKLGISYLRVDHEPAFTIEACHEVDALLGAEICKNLFLCNRQQTDFYLLLLEGDKVFHTKDLSHQLGCSRLSFGSPEKMEELLGVTPGSATLLALVNDAEKRVRLLVDKPLLQKKKFGCHPCINTSSLLMDTSDVFEKILPALGREYTLVDLPEDEEP